MSPAVFTAVGLSVFAAEMGDEPGFSYEPAGDLVEGSGEGRKDDTLYLAGLRFPLEHGPAYANSQVWGRGGGEGPGGRQCDEANYRYPWRDNFCETRRFRVDLCPAGTGHQGQDIRPATCEADKHWAVAAESGRIVRIGRFSVTLIGEDGTQHRYLHLEPTSLVVSRGDEVARGERIGRVSNAFFDRDGNRVLTTIHLHYDVQMNLEGRNVFVPPYASLVESYQALLRSPEERCAPIPGVGREIAETEGCVDWFGPARYWRREESEQARGGGLYWTNTHPGRHPANYARYRLDLRSAGRYTVEAHVVAPYNESRRALYVVRHRGGERPAETEVQVDQRDEQGWVPVGTFAFAKGGDQWVEVRDNTGERRKPFSLDSLRLVPEPSEPSESPE